MIRRLRAVALALLVTGCGAGAVVNVIIGFILSAIVFAAHWENLAR